MTNNARERREIEALGQLIERFGADRTRWPAPERLRFAALLKDHAVAQRMLREAAAFDRLLDLAPLVAEPRHAALCERIVAKAMTEPRVTAQAASITTAAGRPPEIELAGSNVASMAAARERGATSRPVRPRWMPERSSWPVAALLAASLVVGIFAGSTGVFPEVGLGLAGVAASDADIEGRALALGPDVGGTADEDTL